MGHVARAPELDRSVLGACSVPGGQRRVLEVLGREVEIFVGVEEELGHGRAALVVVTAPVTRPNAWMENILCSSKHKFYILTIDKTQSDLLSTPSASEAGPVSSDPEPPAAARTVRSGHLVPAAAEPVDRQQRRHAGRGHLWAGAAAGVPHHSLDVQPLHSAA